MTTRVSRGHYAPPANCPWPSVFPTVLMKKACFF